MPHAPPLSADDRAYVYSVVRRIMKSDEQASDVTQDAMLLAHRYRDNFRGESAYRTWLYRIATTTALGHLRRQRRSREDLASADHDRVLDAIDPQPSPEAVTATRELAARALDILDDVSADQRRVFLLRAHDCTESEISSRLGISVANVKIRTYRARQRLRRDLDALCAA